ncbi:hypothetical protein RWE15_06170 [Virgibacillus halophilus]|uniref:SH3b domain-containing protein n=2 Tax=Tigheibacillus halophilus TaxID=361280 RepID=A0ABU5C4A9_9BACI|nr:hypothetical protein [Virgibacillus halophilus]
MSKEEKLQFKKMVNEKRSKLMKVEQSVVIEEKKEDKTLTASRVTRSSIKSFKKRIKYFVVILFILLLVGAGMFTNYKFDLIDRFFADTAIKNETDKNLNTEGPNNNPVVSSDNQNKDNDNQMEEQDDIRYVNVRSAYIRAEHDLDSEASSVTGFGSPYKVSDSYADEENDVEWLQVTSVDSDKETGWISSKLLTIIKDNSSDDSLVASLDELLGIDLNNHTEILGQNEETMEYADRDHTVKDGKITSVTLQTNPAAKDMITARLGEPQLKSKNALMYSGGKYYYIIDLPENDNAESITIGIRDASED